MYYTPTGINDWYLLTVVPMEVANTKTMNIMKLNYVQSGIVVAVFLLLLIYIVRSEKKKQTRLMEIAYTDVITGGDNYKAFCLKAENALEKDTAKMALLCMDIDRFKLVNDLFGFKWEMRSYVSYGNYGAICSAKVSWLHTGKQTGLWHSCIITPKENCSRDWISSAARSGR